MIPTESAHCQGEVFQQLKQRGIQEVSLVVSEGLKGIGIEVGKHFTGVYHQKCVVHLKRHTLAQVKPMHKGEMAMDLKEIFDLDTLRGSYFPAKKMFDFCTEMAEPISSCQEVRSL